MPHERILVVDDEPGVVHSCVRILNRRGFTVTGLNDSAEVPELLRRETFDLLLTDIKMPRIDGLELLGMARQVDPHITVVLITGYGTMEDAIRAIRLGGQGFLMKPFGPAELIAAVEDSLARRAIIRDSLRLQTLLPLLQINQALQASDGAAALIQRALEITARETGASRITLFNCHPARQALVEVSTVPPQQVAIPVDPAAAQRVKQSGQPQWKPANGDWLPDHTGQPNIVAALLPLRIQENIGGMMAVEAGPNPFGPISLELLSVVAGQLAIIIENVRLHQEAQSLRAFNEDIIQTMTNGLVAVDQQGQLTAFNPAAAKMLGCAPATVLHRPLTEALPQAATLTAIIERTLTTGEPQPRQEINLPQANGPDLPIAISTELLATHQDGWRGVMAALEDLSQIKALEADRRRLDRLAALGEMSAVVAHEIRNPVAGIAAGVDYLTRDAAPDSPEGQGAAMIRQEVRRVNRILEDILFVARPMHLDPVVQPLRPIIDHVLERSHPHLRANQVQINLALGEHLPDLKVDAERLEQVLTNLVINAAQAMPTGGVLSIKAQPAADERLVSIIISDTGSGIADEARERIFDPFFTTKAKGTGLGLSVARRIVEAHHGVIRLESGPQKGASFIIDLPRIIP